MLGSNATTMYGVGFQKKRTRSEQATGNGFQPIIKVLKKYCFFLVYSYLNKKLDPEKNIFCWIPMNYWRAI